jgi:toxin ParE1/3/4
MSNYKLTNKAVEDLETIWNYTFEKWSEQQADKYYALLIDSCHIIGENPNIGKNYFGVTIELFGLKQIDTLYSTENLLKTLLK